MGAKTAISVEEYLRTSFPDLDKEYRDGELEERSLPNYSHSRTQAKLVTYFESRQEQYSVFPASELRLQLRPGLFLIPDVCVFHPAEPPDEVPAAAPYIVIEILSPDDSMNQVREKLEEFRVWGAKHVWLVDPRSKRMYTCEPGLTEVRKLCVPELGLELGPPDVFAKL